MDGTELCTRTHKVEEVSHCPSVIWIWMTLSLATAEGIGEVGHEEIRRAKGMGAGESVVCCTIPVCPQ